MGLCKCPKKNVTNQFCFEHRVNVCEHCMVKNHAKCVVQSYLLWLDDSDYDPNCQLCKTELAEGDCIRLICYHVFHWECLNKYASNLPPHTAPAGYTCPICNLGIFPPSNMVSPVAESLRNALLGVNWARCGLAFPLADENTSVQQGRGNSTEASPRKINILQTEEHSSKVIEVNSHYTNTAHPHKTDVSRSSRPEPYGAPFTSGPFAAARKMYDSTDHGHLRPSVVDYDDDKYKRRSAVEWFSRWFHSRALISGNRGRDPSFLYKRWVVLAMLVLIGLCTLVILFIRMGRSSADSDPLLDPHLNPNIRVEDSIDGIQESAKVIDKSNVIPLDNGAKHIVPR